MTTTTAPPAPLVDARLAVLLADWTGLDLHTDPDTPVGTAVSAAWAADPHGLYARATSPDFGEWISHAARAGGCAHPIRLVGGSVTADATTGQVLSTFDTNTLPDRVLYKACGNRRESACPACSKVYRYDAYQMIKAGLVGGKDVPETIAEHPAVFLTLVAPSFGLVHTGPSKQHDVRFRCRPRREQPRCEHGRPMFCFAQHAHTDRALGQPLCLDCYHHEHQVVFNHFAPVLWDRTITRLRALLRAMCRRLGVKVAIRYAKVAEMQRRGVVHYHAVLRVDGYDPDDKDAILIPPAQVTVEVLSALIERAAAETAIRSPGHPDQPTGWVLAWGAPLPDKHADVRVIRRGVPDAQITERHVAGYLAKYATKSTEATGHVSRRLTAATIDLYADPDTHPGRLIDACWRLGRPLPDLSREDNATRPYRGLRRWAHELGKGGHYTTKSHRYSVTLGALRAARRVHMAAPTPSTGPVAADPADHTSTTAVEQDQAATVVIAEWAFVGAGWHTTGDAALALAAADAARMRRPAGLAA